MFSCRMPFNPSFNNPDFIFYLNIHFLHLPVRFHDKRHPWVLNNSLLALGLSSFLCILLTKETRPVRERISRQIATTPGTLRRLVGQEEP